MSDFTGGVDDFDKNSPTDDDKLWAMLAYIFSPIVPIIILLMDDRKERPFIKEHNMQALVWGVLSFLVSLVAGWLFCIPPLLMWFAAIYWGWKAYQGESVTIPVITDMINK